MFATHNPDHLMLANQNSFWLTGCLLHVVILTILSNPFISYASANNEHEFIDKSYIGMMIKWLSNLSNLTAIHLINEYKKNTQFAICKN